MTPVRPFLMPAAALALVAALAPTAAHGLPSDPTTIVGAGNAGLVRGQDVVRGFDPSRITFLPDADLAGADFYEARLHLTVLAGTDCRNANFTRADLTTATLFADDGQTQTRFDGAVFTDALITSDQATRFAALGVDVSGAAILGGLGEEALPAPAPAAPPAPWPPFEGKSSGSKPGSGEAAVPETAGAGVVQAAPSLPVYSWMVPEDQWRFE